MKSLLLTAGAFLLGLAINVAAIPTPAPLDNSCTGGDCVNAAADDLTRPYSAIIWKNDLATTGDQDSDAMLAKRVDQGTAEAEDAVLKCDIHEKSCPMGWRYVDRGTHCFCIPDVGFFKRDAGLATREDTSDSRVPFDPHMYCANRVKCPSGSVGLWDNRAGRCFCGLRRPNISINTPDEPEASRLQFDGKKLNTANELANRLLGERLTFPTGISNPDWTAIQATLALLHEYIKSQSDLHQVCTGAKNPQAFGFKLEIFRRICTPEINVPVPHPEIVKAEQKVNSALFIDTILQRNNNNFAGACKEVKGSGVIPSPLDSQWVLSVLCNQGH